MTSATDSATEALLQGIVAVTISIATAASRALGNKLAWTPDNGKSKLAEEWQWRIKIILEIPRPSRVMMADQYVFLMRLDNYKVVIEYGSSASDLQEGAAVLDTGAGPNCIREDAVPQGARSKIREDPDYRVFDANGNALSLRGVVTLRVRAGRRLVKTDFIVCQTLQVALILGTEFIDRQVEQIRPGDQTMRYWDGTTIPIHREWPSLPQRPKPKPTKKRPRNPKGNDGAARIAVAKTTVVPPHSQQWVQVVADTEGLVTLEPRTAFLQERGLSLANGIADVRPLVPFRVLVANMRDRPRILHKRTVIGRCELHPTFVAETNVSLLDACGVPCNVQVPQGRVGTTLTISNGLPTEVLSLEPGSETEPATGKEDEIANLKLERFPEGYHEEARKVLRRHQEMWNGKLGEIRATEHRIELLPDAKPHRQMPYRMGHREREFERTEIDKMLKDNVIRASRSEWASPIVLAPKGDGSLRFCVDYRRVNAASYKDSYPLPRMDDCIDSLGEAKFFSTLDANSGYWQIPMREKDIPLTAFSSHQGLYEYVRMPFGLQGAPATFQRALDMILSGYRWQTCLIYLDDVIIFSQRAEDHLRDVDQVLDVLRHAGISLRFGKCLFFTDSVRYLGHIVRPGTLEVDQSHVRALREAEPPRTVSELRSFLGFCNVYRRFVPSYTDMARPLYDCLKGSPKKATRIHMGSEQMRSFEQLVSAVTSPPVLSLPRRGLRYSIDTDSSQYQIGCALFQTHEDGVRRPLGFWSRKMAPAELNYTVTEQECLAAVHGIKTCRHYLMGVEFDLYTDHAALRWLMDIQEPGRLMRWRLCLSEYVFVIHHRKGYANTQADTLSRLPSTGHTTVPVDMEIPCYAVQKGTDSNPSERIDIHEMLREQERDPFCQRVRKTMDQDRRSAFRENPTTGVLERLLPSHTAVVVPYALQARILRMEHAPLAAGHVGGKRMYETMRKHYYWPRMALDCQDTARNCDACARERVTLQQKGTDLQPFAANAPLESVAMDVLGPLTRTPRGNTHLLVIVDRFSKMVRTVPLRKTDSWSIAKAFVTAWVFVYGPPKTILTDNGSNFRSKFMLSLHKLLGITSQATTAYHPQCNGQAERYNRTVLEGLRKYIGDHHGDWDLYTDVLSFAYNTHVHSTTGLAPFELVLSRAPQPLAFDPEAVSPQLTAKEARFAWLQRIGQLVSTAKKRLLSATKRTKANYDRGRRARTKAFAAGDYAYVRLDKSNAPDGERHKLASVAEGPFRIVSTDGKTAVLQRDRERERINIDRLELAPKPQGRTNNTSKSTPGAGEREGEEGHVIDRITDHQTTADGQTEFKVRWALSQTSTWEPTAHLPYSHIMRYCRRRKIDLPADIDQARSG